MDPTQSNSNDPVADIMQLVNQDGFTPSQHISYEESPAQQGNQESASEGNESSSPSQTVPISRVNELTAARRNAERIAAEQQNTINQMSLQIAQLANRSTVQQPVGPSPEEIKAREAINQLDPSVRDAFDFMLKQATSNITQQVQGLQHELGMVKTNNLATKYNDEVVGRANQLISNWRARGIPGLPEEAFKLAAAEQWESGKSPLRGKVKPQSSSPDVLPRAGNGQFVPNNQNQAVPEYADNTSRNFNATKSADYWAKKLGNKTF